MTQSFQFPKLVLLYGICFPVAILVGYLLATPDDFTTFVVAGLVGLTLTAPLLLRYHHPILILSWNAVLLVFFFPGQPPLWVAMSFGSLLLTLVARALNRDMPSQNVPALTWSLLVLGMIIVVTAYFRGGIGSRVTGDAVYGGRRYMLLISAIVGYFALSGQKIPKNRRVLYTTLFFAGGITAAVPDLILLAGSPFYMLFSLFPVDLTLHQISYKYQAAEFARWDSLAFGSLALYLLMLARFGIRGIFNLSHPWRCCLFLTFAIASLFGGARSVLGLMILTFMAQFYFEGLFRTKYFGWLLFCFLLSMSLILPVAEKLPVQIQRAMSFLPVKIGAAARLDADGTAAWRFEMWGALLPEIPQYFWLGKGCGIDPKDVYFSEELTRRGLAKGYEQSLIAGDYHSGPLSVLVPFGIFGTLSFLGFCLFSIRFLYWNYRYGDPDLKSINLFLLSYFIARFIYYWTVFGGFFGDLPIFTGLVGFAVALNGAKKYETLKEKPALSPIAPGAGQPARLLAVR